MYVAAQNSQLRAYTIADGLPQSQVYDVLQDEMGYLWLGTQGGGLANFDGETFEVWNESDGLLSNYIDALYTANDSLFVGTRKGLSIKVKNNFANFNSPQILQFYNTENVLYVGTKKGLYTYSKNSKLSKISINAEIDSSEINSILFDGNNYWLATNNGLWKLNELSESAAEKTKVEVNNFKSVIQHNNKILAATFDDGVFIMDSENTDNQFLMPEPSRINSMSIQNTDELWIATDNDGITIVETNKFSELKRLNKSSGLATPHIRKVINDDNGNLWIATSGGGLFKYFQNNFKHYDQRSGLKGNRIYAVHNAPDGLWFSSSEAGLTKIDSLGIHPLPNEGSFFDVKIKTIDSDSKGNIWAGSDNRGLLFRETKMVDSLVFSSSETFLIQIDTVSVERTTNHIIDESKGFPSDWVRTVIAEDDYIWAATYAYGIVKFNYYSDNDSLVVRKTFSKRNGITDMLIKGMVKGPDGKLWYSTQNGHLGYIENNKVTGIETGLEQQTAIGTILFHDDTIYLGTSGKGIWYANSANPVNFQQLKGSKNLSSNNIYQLIFDEQGYLWAGSERGVDKIELNKANEIVDVYHFGRNDGFLGIETCLNAVDIDTNGNIWFGAIYGLTKHIPSDGKKASTAPTVYFTGVEERYKSIDSIVLKDWTNSKKVLQLTPEQTQLGFSFRTVDVDHPNEVEYRTKLDDTDWSPWVKENKQNFAGLAYGGHTFSAQSRNYRWQESEPIKFSFFIDSPLYKKDWFQWSVLALAILVLLGIGLFYIRKIKAKNKAAQEQLKTQNYLLTLEQKALQLQMNPHFIFNVLNGVKAMAGNKPEKMDATINSFAILLRETLQNSRKEHISLDQEIKALRHYVEVEQLMAQQPFECFFNIDTNPDAEEILIPPMLIQPFVENAIRHGILKGDKAGKLEIGFTTTETHLQCSIIDNGLGIFKSQSEKPKTDHQSMALTVTKERLESIAGANTLHISEIKNEDGNIDGTKITFKIPLLTDY
ncbi:two-component regulator propeller domain-containing protein [Maribacter sp. BPC-D8]|uniref:sensor histidine kinase n=1 Tax=Maribacter sp. BPC-D8 TaxID=3053613 RepID=UPI002B4A7FAA|nr:two-component regulator propeller domain-containing protein [Maribacter sp. BPC-D8]WRI30060.1 two-component regulator propeller domain-containing protein [Maribacter sp. BPC-D8]